MPRIFDTGIIARRIYSTVDEQMEEIFMKIYFKAKRKNYSTNCTITVLNYIAFKCW